MISVERQLRSIICLMYRRYNQEIEDKRLQLESAEAELDELRELIASFETRVDARLGDLLDQLSELNAETSALDEQLRLIREQRLYGKDLITYLAGAPRPARPPTLSDLPPLELTHRKAAQEAPDPMVTASSPQIPDIKSLYRRLARMYHPDLARNDPDRRMSNEHMAEINRAYQAGDMETLMKLAGMEIPFGVSPPQSARPPSAQMTEQERIEHKLSAVREEIARLSRLPMVKLSLDAKLARHQRRDLLAEMASDLLYKVRRKIAERDYLQSQINHSLNLGDA